MTNSEEAVRRREAGTQGSQSDDFQASKPFLTRRRAVLLSLMNSKQRKTLGSIFSKPTPKSLLWNDIESLFVAIGCEVTEGAGSRISFRFILLREDKTTEIFREDFHRPHPGKEAKTYQVERARKFLTSMGKLP
jgi:hypothetical protein